MAPPQLRAKQQGPCYIPYVLEALTFETILPHQGETFRIRLDDGSIVETRLTEVTKSSWAGPSRAGRRDPFSLLFLGPPNVLLPQRIYRVENDRLGDVDLFLVPLGPVPEGMRYEAVFG